jgi:hypothetical protein
MEANAKALTLNKIYRQKWNRPHQLLVPLLHEPSLVKRWSKWANKVFFSSVRNQLYRPEGKKNGIKMIRVMY